jgi:aminoglycoside 6'-N-acetyltransferase
VGNAGGERPAPVRLQGEATLVRPATPADAAMLERWHADPEVARYWDEETPGAVELVAQLAAPDLDAYIVEAGGEPVGYLQAWFDSGDPDTCGLDMFLVPAARGRGLGPDAARALARHLLAAGWRRVTVDPELWNERAVRAWARAGFRAVEERAPDDEHGRPWLLMELTEG